MTNQQFIPRPLLPRRGRRSSCPDARGRWIAAVVAAAACVVLLLGSAAIADTVESTTGAVIEGKVVARDDKAVTLEVLVGGKPVQRKFPLNLVRAITVGGKREMLRGGGGPTTAATQPAGVGAAAQRTRQEIDALVAAAATPPDWFAAAAMNIPKGLDLSWPDKPEGPWNNQKNVGQFIWDVVNPNPNRWRDGVRLMHHLMDLHKADRDLRARAAATLGGMYHHLFQDYARAAYWLRQAGARQDAVALAECYWKLGSKPMAAELLNGMRQVRSSAVKLWADMGETDRAVKLTASFARGGDADWAYLYAADACRQSGRPADAVRYYEKVLALPDDKRIQRNKDRARAGIEAIKLFDTLDVAKVADGTYKASSLGYEGQIEVEVSVAGGRIGDVKVVKHKEKQFYAALTDTPAQIIRKNAVKGVDATSRATITSEAIINATAKALGSGAKQ